MFEKKMNNVSPTDKNISTTMFSSFEYYLLMSWVYPFIGTPIHINRNKKSIADAIFPCEGVTSYTKVQVNTLHHSSPTYIGGPNMLIPVGGGTSYDYKTVYTVFRGKHNVYWNYDYWMFGNIPRVSDTTYVSNEAALSKIIPVEEHGRFPISFPMKIIQSNLDSVKLYLHNKTGLVADNRKDLLAQTLIKTRPFGTVMAPLIATIMFIGSWALYKHNKANFPYIYKNKLPPTDFINKIKSLVK